MPVNQCVRNDPAIYLGAIQTIKHTIWCFNIFVDNKIRRIYIVQGNGINSRSKRRQVERAMKMLMLNVMNFFMCGPKLGGGHRKCFSYFHHHEIEGLSP